MPHCLHKWSTQKRWSEFGKYHVIQRCRRCNEWIKREIDYAELSRNEPSMKVQRIELKGFNNKRENRSDLDLHDKSIERPDSPPQSETK